VVPLESMTSDLSRNSSTPNFTCPGYPDRVIYANPNMTTSPNAASPVRDRAAPT